MSDGPGSTEIIGAAWLAIAEEMGRVIVRTAISPNVKERRDCSAALFTASGELLAQASHIPMHLGSLLDFARLVARQPDLSEGDVFACNDPYNGGGAHLNDIGVMTPVTFGDRIIALAGTIAHHPDVGGRVSGSESPDSTEIYQEGIRIPPVRLCRGWKKCSDVWNMLSANSRLPEVIEADLRSQISACRLAIGRIAELAERYGTATLALAAGNWLDYAERRFRARCRAHGSLRLPLYGELDDDGRRGSPGIIAGELVLAKGRATVDLRRCSSQVAGALNAPVAATRAAVYFALKAVVDPDCPSNEGYFRAIDIRTRPGTLVDPQPPAATGHRSEVCQKLADTIIRTFAAAGHPECTAGSHGASLIILSGSLPNGMQFVDYESFAGGIGASAAGPGQSGMMANTTNSSNLPIEVMEREYPLRVRAFALRKASGGAGLHRGGDGIVREIEILIGPVALTTALKDARVAPTGVRGGKDGARSRCFVKRLGDGVWRRVPSHASDQILNTGDMLRIETAGGGGWCAQRSPRR